MLGHSTLSLHKMAIKPNQLFIMATWQGSQPYLVFYHANVVMLFRSQTSFLYYFLFLYKFSVLYYSKTIGKLEKIKLDCYLLKIKPKLCLFIVFKFI